MMKGEQHSTFAKTLCAFIEHIFGPLKAEKPSFEYNNNIAYYEPFSSSVAN